MMMMIMMIILITRKKREKIDNNYCDLKYEIKWIWNCRSVQVIPIVIGALGAVFARVWNNTQVSSRTQVPPATARPVARTRLVSKSAILATHGAQLPWAVCTYAKLPEGWAHKGKWMCQCFSPKLGQPQQRFSVGLKVLAPSTLIPMVLEQNPPTLRLLTTVRRKNRCPTQDGANAACC